MPPSSNPSGSDSDNSIRPIPNTKGNPMPNPRVTQAAIDELHHRGVQLLDSMDDITGDVVNGWFYQLAYDVTKYPHAFGNVQIYLAPADDPYRALRALNTFIEFLTIRSQL